MKFFLAIGLLITSSLLHAQDVVKVFSAPCSNLSNAFIGSGVLIRHQSELLVLTSEHVILPSNDGYCHKVMRENGEFHAARYKASSWSKGLALLTLEENVSIAAIEASSFASVMSGDAVVSEGYPFRSSVISVDTTASVLAYPSERHQLLGLENVILLKSFGEFGMSGGAVWKDGKLAAILSHQYIELISAGLSRIGSFQPESKFVETQLVAISAADVLLWINDVFSGKAQEPFQVDPAARVRGEQHVDLNGVRFTFVPNPAPLNLKTNGDIGGRAGGGDGSGIGGRTGGGDGGGIGGTSDFALPDGAGFIRIQRASSNLQAPSTDPQLRALWQKAIVSEVGIARGVLSNKKILPIYSLGGFFKLLGDGQAVASFQTKSAGMGFSTSHEELLKTIYEQAETLKKQSLQHHHKSEPLIEFIESISNISAASLTNGEILISTEDLNEMIRSHFWKTIFSENVSEGIELKRSLVELYRSH
jgi:hypothetical protein